MTENTGIGTSGWMYDHWIGKFYPKNIEKKKMLNFFSDKFSSVEINNTFYQLPEKDIVKHWKEEVPENFVFSVKASRYITHMKNLKDPQESTENFFNIIKYFGNKIGPILFQLSPNWHKNESRLDNFVKILPEGYDYVFELRHKTWFCDEIYEILENHNISFCLHDFNGKKTPLRLTAKDLIYIRLHGVEGNYQKKYPKKDLEWWSQKIEDNFSDVKNIYTYFNNDAYGNAIENAIEMRKLLKDFTK